MSTSWKSHDAATYFKAFREHQSFCRECVNTSAGPKMCAAGRGWWELYEKAKQEER